MKIHTDHAQFAQDLVLRITSNPDFKTADIPDALKLAFAVAEKFFPAYDEEVDRLKSIDDKPKGNAKSKVEPESE